MTVTRRSNSAAAAITRFVFSVCWTASSAVVRPAALTA
jgi:hypothetical protein